MNVVELVNGMHAQGAPVTITEEPSVTIVTDLDKVLAGR